MTCMLLASVLAISMLMALHGKQRCRTQELGQHD